MDESVKENAFTALARRRRSIRVFARQKIPSDVVVELMKAPLMAPSSKSKRPWEFILVDDPKLLHQLSECKVAGAAFVEKASLAVVVAVDKSASDTWIEDASVATIMLLLQAESLGLGGCWVQIRLRGREDGTPASEIVREVLNIPSHLEVESMVAVGYKGQERKVVSDDKLLWEKVHINKY